MYIEQLGISNVRNLSNVTIETEPGINFFFGENAAGKTAILEAIHLLSRTKSFRSPRINDLIQRGEDFLTVTTKLIEKDRKVVTGLKKNKEEMQLKYNGARVAKASEQARNVPLFIITPESHRILSGNPKERRHWLDWAMFHVEPGYMTIWQKYHLALRHRNALLREKADKKEFVVWEGIMGETAAKLTEFREKYLKNVQKHLNMEEKSPFQEVKIRQTYPDKDMSEYLAQERKADMAAGHTRSGPHRADVLININGQVASKTLSRGQAKLFLIFLISSQAIEFINKNNKKPILLVDDIAAELDTGSLNKALTTLASLKLQVFINAVLENTIGSVSNKTIMFHVERGKVIKMVE